MKFINVFITYDVDQPYKGKGEVKLVLCLAKHHTMKTSVLLN
jgi:hypothetical protein